MRRYILYFLLVPGVLPANAWWAQQNTLRVWYEQPARQWEECVPLGNGRLGAMPDGGIHRENITQRHNIMVRRSTGCRFPGSPKHLQKIRQLLFEGKNDEAEAIMYKSFVCKGPGSGEGNGANVPYGTYEVLGNLHLDYNYGVDTTGASPTDYTRELSLNDAVARIAFKLAGTTYKREYFASFNNDVIVIRLEVDKPGKINIDLSAHRPEKFLTRIEGNELQITGQLNNGTNGKGMQHIARTP